MNTHPRKTHAPQKQKGFTLLEVLLAFVVFALIFSGILQILGQSMRNTVRSEEMTEAALWAQSVMAEVGIGGELEEGGESGVFADKYHWNMDVSQWDGADVQDSPYGQSGLQLYKVTLDVRWGTSKKRRKAHFSTLRLVQEQPR